MEFVLIIESIGISVDRRYPSNIIYRTPLSSIDMLYAIPAVSAESLIRARQAYASRKPLLYKNRQVTYARVGAYTGRECDYR